MPVKKTRPRRTPALPGTGDGSHAVAIAAPEPHPDSEAEAGRIREIFTRLSARNPAPMTELTYADPFTLLVAVVLSAQATDVSVNKATGPLFAAAATPDAILALGEDGLKPYIQTIGLYNAKARNVIALCRRLVEDFDGSVPRDRDTLESLPGVGRKTANVVLNTVWGDPVIAVDTHVFRVANRLRIATGATPLAVELGLEAAVPDAFKRHAHHWLILHGRYTCVARKPLCASCPVSDLCPWPEKSA